MEMFFKNYMKSREAQLVNSAKNLLRCEDILVKVNSILFNAHAECDLEEGCKFKAREVLDLAMDIKQAMIYLEQAQK